MDVKRRTDYAIRMMMRLTVSQTHGEPMSVKFMADADDVPYQFARAIQRDLADAGLIKVVRGARGGALLKKDPKDITLLDIVRATQGHPECSPCTRDEEWCRRMQDCTVHRVWRELDKITIKYLQSVSLADMA